MNPVAMLFILIIMILAASVVALSVALFVKKKSQNSDITDQQNNDKPKSKKKMLIALAVVFALGITIAVIIKTTQFKIEGKWRNDGENTYAMMKQGAIISFDGTHCNVLSPSDTYAFYRDHDNDDLYRIDITDIYGSYSTSLQVNIIDKNHIVIYTPTSQKPIQDLAEALENEFGNSSKDDYIELTRVK